MGLFSQIINGEDTVREKCLKFLSTNYKKLGPEVFDKEAEDVLIYECKKVLQVIILAMRRIVHGRNQGEVQGIQTLP